MDIEQAIIMKSDDERESTNINRIAVKTPPFWPEEPKLCSRK